MVKWHADLSEILRKFETICQFGGEGLVACGRQVTWMRVFVLGGVPDNILDWDE